jgi:hypothetical protein
VVPISPEERRRYEAQRLVYEERERGREARNDAALRVAREQRQRDKDAAAVKAALRRG